MKPIREKKFIFRHSGVRERDDSACRCADKFWNDESFDIEVDADGNEIFLIEKATDIKKRTRGKYMTPEYQALHNVTRKIKPAIQIGIESGVQAFRKKINLHDLVSALDQGDLIKVRQVVPWTELDDELKKNLEKVIETGIGESAAKSKFIFRSAIKKLIGVDPKIRFDISNERIKNYAEKYTASLVEGIRQQTQEAISNFAMDAINRGIPSRQSADKIKQIIGLNSRQSQALINREQQLIKSGFKGTRLETALNDYRDKQLTYRAETIARTEASFINNNGLAMIVEENVSSGYIDPSSAKKKWVVTPHDNICEVCLPMNGQTVGIYDDFELDDGQSIQVPPAHPNCLCGWSLVFN